jgi:hypothetical protein
VSKPQQSKLSSAFNQPKVRQILVKGHAGADTAIKHNEQTPSYLNQKAVI